jgi:hypothetical protein
MTTTTTRADVKVLPIDAETVDVELPDGERLRYTRRVSPSGLVRTTGPRVGKLAQISTYSPHLGEWITWRAGRGIRAGSPRWEALVEASWYFIFQAAR